MSVFFFWVHGVWIVARNKQITREPLRGSRDLFVPRYDSYPMNPEKRHSFLNKIRNLIWTYMPILGPPLRDQKRDGGSHIIWILPIYLNIFVSSLLSQDIGLWDLYHMKLAALFEHIFPFWIRPLVTRKGMVGVISDGSCRFIWTYLPLSICKSEYSLCLFGLIQFPNFLQFVRRISLQENDRKSINFVSINHKILPRFYFGVRCIYFGEYKFRA